MKKFVSLMLSILMVIMLFPTVVSATASDQSSDLVHKLETLKQYRRDYQGNVSDEEIQNFQHFWSELKNLGALCVDDLGHIFISDTLAKTQDVQQLLEENQRFLYMLDFINSLVDFKFIEISDSIDLVALEITDESIKLIAQDNVSSVPPSTPYYEPHDCGLPRLNVKALCTQNYNELVDYLDAAILTSKLNPDIDPWLTTASFWVGRVLGPWNYKKVPGYSPYNKEFCMTYGDYDYMHQTSEWLGNYNYGFTGSFLFPLDVLHLGSQVVAGFDEKDKEDWPAIDEGFYDAPQ